MVRVKNGKDDQAAANLECGDVSTPGRLPRRGPACRRFPATSHSTGGRLRQVAADQSVDESAHSKLTTSKSGRGIHQSR
jgi:hypothetical protein